MVRDVEREVYYIYISKNYVGNIKEFRFFFKDFEKILNYFK